MAITGLHLEGFTVFDDARFDFASGLNVLVGENGTGKSHVLKLLWAVGEGVRRKGHAGGSPAGVWASEWVRSTLAVGTLREVVRHGPATPTARASVEVNGREAAALEVASESTDAPDSSLRFGTDAFEGAKLTFVPSREVLSLLPGFVAAWDKRESAFDRTYRELCADLSVPPLRTLSPGQRALLAPLEAALGGTLVQLGERFTIETAEGDLQMPMVGEGLRKIAQLIQLVRNGTLEPGGILLWDEPEASLSPRLAHTLAATITGLVRMGVQVFLSTHDYVLASELSLAISTSHARSLETVEGAFFGLSRVGNEPVTVERASRFEALQTNPILDAFTSLHDREALAQVDEAS